MRIFNVNKKHNLKKNLYAIYDFAKEATERQKEANKEWEKNFIREVERIDLNDDNEQYLYEIINRRMDERKRMWEKLSDLIISENCLKELCEKYGDRKCK